MKKENGSEPIRLTHTEILSYAIRSAYYDWQRSEEEYKRFKELDPDMAEQMHNADKIKRQKLEALYCLYKLETGTDYGLD